MNKKFLSILVSAFMLINISGISFADKKDVGDPVLQQVITELSNKMPRFINKYGASVFVADEQITRGTLLQALYEYDKKASSGGGTTSAAGVVSKKDYDALNAKVLALEKKVKAGGSAAGGTNSSSGGQVDFVELMGDLETNMPILLDNTLADSKVFKALEQKVNDVKENSGGVAVASGNVKGINEKDFNNLKNTVVQISQSYASMDKKLNDLETSSRNSSEISQDTMNDLQRNFDNLTRKVDDVEISIATLNKGSSVKGPSQDDFDTLKLLVGEMNKVYADMDKKLDDLEREQNSFMVASKMSSSDSNVSQEALTDLQRNISALSKKVDNVEVSLASVKNTGANRKNTAADAQMMTDFRNFQKEIETVNKKVSAMETQLAKGGGKGSAAAAYSGPSQDDFDDLKDTIDQMNRSYSSLDKKISDLEIDRQKYLSANKNTKGGTNVSQAALAKLQKNMDELNRKFDDVEISLDSVKKSAAASNKNSATMTAAADSQALNDLKRNFQREIEAVNKKVSSMETSLAKNSRAADSSIYSGPTREDFNSLKNTVTQMNKNYVAINKKLDNLEKDRQVYMASSKSSSSDAGLSSKQMQAINAKINSIRQSVDDIKAENSSGYSDKNTADIKKIEKRLTNLERSEKSSGSSSKSGGSSDSGSSKAGTVAKISLGLSMVAALFVAR